MRILILNSAHGKYPVGAEGWIQATRQAIRELAAEETAFICSTDPAAWNLTLWLAGQTRAWIGCIVKTGDNDEGRREYSRLTEGFHLDPRRVRPVFLDTGPFNRPGHPKDTWQIRDRLAVQIADAVYPVSIRPGGRLDHLLGETGFRDKIRNDFRISWSPNGFIPRYTLTGRPWRRLPPGNWLVHWTRACPGAWPGEDPGDFFRDVLDHPGTYVRSAGATLRRIVLEGSIRGAARHMPANTPAVAFTALSPGDAFALMRWRKRYVQYTFEPWGIAIRAEELVRRGAREITYTGGKPDGPLVEPLFSHAGGRNGRWADEREWRLPGTLALDEVPPDAVRLIVPGEPDADDLGAAAAARFPLHVLFRS